VLKRTRHGLELSIPCSASQSHRRSKPKNKQSMVCSDAVCPPQPPCISSRVESCRQTSHRDVTDGPDPAGSTPSHKHRPGKQRKKDSDSGAESRLCRFKLEQKQACLSLEWLQGCVCSPSPQRRPKIGRDNGPAQLPGASMRRARSAQQARAAEETRGVTPSHPSMTGVGSAVLAGGSSCSLRG
jgi:hypothetical protein